MSDTASLKELTELAKGVGFGNKVIADYKKKGEPVPDWVYDRQLELEGQVIKTLMDSLSYMLAD